MTAMSKISQLNSFFFYLKLCRMIFQIIIQHVALPVMLDRKDWGNFLPRCYCSSSSRFRSLIASGIHPPLSLTSLWDGGILSSMTSTQLLLQVPPVTLNYAYCNHRQLLYQLGYITPYCLIQWHGHLGILQLILPALVLFHHLPRDLFKFSSLWFLVFFNIYFYF